MFNVICRAVDRHGLSSLNGCKKRPMRSLRAVILGTFGDHEKVRLPFDHE